jgi:hypothetical protein
MRKRPFRQTTILLLVLAILVGPGVSVMSMAATTGVSMSSPDNDEGCKGCLPGKMTLADCGMVCLALPAIIPPVAAFHAGIERSPWCWHDEQIGRYQTEPPTGPPRSDR